MVHETEIADDTPPENYKPKVMFEQIKNDDVYFTIEKLLNTTVAYIKQINGIIDVQEKRDDAELIENGIEKFNNILAPEYKEEYNITDEKIREKTSIYDNYELKIDKIYLSEKTNSIFYYLVYATLDDKNFNLIIKTDTNNLTFCVYLSDYVEDKKYSYKMDEKDINFSDSEIEKNNANTFKYTRIEDQYVIDRYLDDYKDMMISNVEKAYDRLDDKYKEKRFDTLEKFKKYVENNKEEIQNKEIASYLKNTYKDYTQYVGKDQYGNIYVFDSYYIMDYKVQLDDYTLPDEELDKQYMNLSTQAKVVNNINKWIKMLNNRDYTAAFNVLDETFRTQNFDNDVDNFEQYMRERFPEHYDFEQIEYSEESGISVQTLTLKNIAGGSLDEEIEETIYMQIGEGTDFVMSFNVI